MVIHIDARKLTDSAGLHAVLGEAFGFTPGYGKNLDALVDCLTHLDDPTATMSRVQVLPGQLVLLVIDHAQGLTLHTAQQLKLLIDVTAFVNWRRLAKKQLPILAIAYDAA